MPGTPAAEAPGSVLGLRRVPQLGGDDGGERVLDDHAIGVGPRDSAPLLSDRCVAGFPVQEGAAVHGVPQERPDRPLAPRGRPVTVERRGGWHAPLIQAMSDGRDAAAPIHVSLEDVSDDLALASVDDEGDALTLGLPPPGIQNVTVIPVVDRSTKTVGRRAAGEIAPVGVRPEPALHDLAELNAVVVGHRALEAFNELSRDPGLVRARVVRVDHPDARASQRVLVKGGLVRLEAGEATDVVSQDNRRLALARIQAQLGQGEKALTAAGVEPAAIVRKLLDDSVAVGRGPRPHGLPLCSDGKILVRAGTTEERIGGIIGVAPRQRTDAADRTA